MTVHKLSAGDGYAYYTSEVASADELRAGGRELGDYYTVEGMPPGQWVGHSEQLLGVTGEVTEAQMKALFGEGLHPEAASILAAGGSANDVKLGQKYHQYGAADTTMTRRIDEEVARFRRTSGPAWSGPENADKAPPIEAMHEIRSRIGGELFRDSHGRNARSNEELARYVTTQTTPSKQTVAGYDLVFSPAKSVSLLWALGGDEARKAVEAAHNEAIKETITFLENNATYTRRGKNGVRQIDVDGGLVATQFRHYDSRAGDPQLHDHVVIANKVMGVDGKWSSLDGRTLYKMGVAASETYNAKVIEKVCASLGVSTVARSTGSGEPVYEVAGIDLESIHRASSRRTNIAGAINRLETEFTSRHGYAPSDKQKIALAQQATLETRPEKKSARRLSELVDEWQKDYSSEMGMPVGPTLLEHVRSAGLGASAGPSIADLNVHEHARQIVHELSAKRASWGRNYVIAQTRRHLKEAFPGQSITDETVEKVTRSVTGTHSLQVTPEAITPSLREFQRTDGTSQFQQADSALFTSHEVLNAEHRILAAGQKTVIPAVSMERFDAVLAKHTEAAAKAGGPALSQGQIDLARAFATDEKLLTLGIGPAGTGKTTSLSLAADTVRDTGGRVIGLAPTAAAAAVMSGDLGTEATTIDAFLATHRNQQQNQQDNGAGARSSSINPSFILGAGDVIIVDEAGMVTTPKLAEVVAVAARNGAVIRAIGDDRQLGAIGSGGALRLLNNEVGAVRLEEVHRFRTEGESEASLALREPPAAGVDTPFHWYLENKRVTAGTTEAMTQDALAAWMADTQAGKTSLLIATDNATVTDLNARAQAARIATGDLTDGIGPITETTPSVVLRDGLRAYAGDTAVTRKNDRTLQVNQGKDFVKNNDVWTIEKVTADPATDAAAGQERQRITLRHAGHRGRITVDADYLHEHGQLGYAATVHRAQGATVDTAHAILDERTDRAGAYVAATRGRETNRLYVALGDDNDQAVTRDSVLSTITANYDRTLSAHEAVRIEAVRTGDVATLAGVYNEVEKAAWEAKTRTIAASVLGPRTAVQFTSHEAWGAVTTHLRTAESQGLDPASLLAQAAGVTRDSTGRGQHADTGHLPGFDGAQDPAAVLAYRLEQRIDAAHRLLANADQRPLGAVSDEHLTRLAQQATQHAAGTGLPRRSPGEMPMDTQWAARPFALMRTDKLADARTDALQKVQAIDPNQPVDASTRKAQWTVQAMTVELERRQDLSPTQATIERTARGEEPRTAHQVTIGDAIRNEQQLRSVALPQASTASNASMRPAATPSVSDDLAPSVLVRDELVPSSYRTELDRLRAHLGQRVMIRGAQLAEEKPAWTNALGPVPGKDAKAAEWHRIAAETEAYRNRYNIGTHEAALIPKQYRDDPTAQRLIERATALHKHSELTTVAPRTATQIQQGTDEAAITDRMTTDQAAARRVIDRMRAERAAASDTLPAPQQREARIVDALQAESAPQQGDDMSAAVARVLTRHRAQAAAAADTAKPQTPKVDGNSARGPQDQNTKQPHVNETKDATHSTNRNSGWGKKAEEAVQRKKAASEKPTTKSAQKEAASAARKAAEAADRSRGRSL
ncbi:MULTISPECIES: MobF family relaxase [unclassified Arthrobacter]|uniref:MobF family relaxase n=1 Tax=unclassified Arthrobacter TaxID=235627 RepID=UPI00177FFC25|nr:MULTISPECIES: MobF family relaxase [unclassified Arthrobacter]MBE0010141.1 conjugal transfer protein TraA [Arthrobacter sp. AET 35A]NOJ64075.1 relaxase domain-containing protein [Arthrobacter sp. 147(2020)]